MYHITFPADPSTLESGIDVGQGINVGPGKFVKKNKRRALTLKEAGGDQSVPSVRRFAPISHRIMLWSQKFLTLSINIPTEGGKVIFLLS